MSVTGTLGTLATIASLAIAFLGLPAQIIMNYRHKSCQGIASPLIYSACLTYTLWAIYGWVKPDWFLFVADAPGCVLAFILLFQLFHYRKKEVVQ